MTNKPTPADFSPTVPEFPVIGQYQPIYGKFDLTTYIQGASDYEIMSFLVQCYNATLKGYSDVTQLSKDTATAYNQLQSWVNTWFDELDVSQEINAKIDKMVANGSFANLLHSTFDEQINNNTTNAVTTWLQANVNPVGSAVTVDKSLTISGSAADANVTGNKFDKVNETISDLFLTGNLLRAFSFEQGGVYGNGDLFSSNKSIRTSLIQLPTLTKFTVPPAKKVSIFSYNKNSGAYIGNPIYSKTSNFEFSGNDNYRVTVDNVDGSDISPTESGITVESVNGVISEISSEISNASFLFGTDTLKDSIIFDKFEIGGIYGDGSNYVNEKQIRTKGYVSPYCTMKACFKDSSKKLSVFEYDLNGKFVQIIAFNTSAIIVTVRANYNYRIVIANSDDTPVDLNTTVTLPNVAFNNDFKSNVYEALIAQNSTKIALPEFEKGGLYGDGSESPSSNDEIRSKIPLYMPSGNYLIENPNKHKVYVIYYKADFTYIANSVWGESSEYIPFSIPINSFVRVVEKNSNGIEPSDASITLFIDSSFNTNVGYYKNGVMIASKEGENLDVPTASLLSIKEAFKNGYDAYRLNICKTSDGYYVLSHNRNINETARNPDGSVIEEIINIDQHTLAELNQYDYGIKFGYKFAGMKITQFNDAISVCSKLGLRLDIEWKYPAMTQEDAENLYTSIVVHGYTNKNWHWVAYNSDMINYFKAVCDYVNIEVLVDPKNIDWNLITEASSSKHDVVVGYSSSQGSPSSSDIVSLRKLNVVQNKGTARNVSEMIEQIDNGVTEIEVNFKNPKKALINYALKY